MLVIEGFTLILFIILLAILVYVAGYILYSPFREITVTYVPEGGRCYKQPMRTTVFKIVFDKELVRQIPLGYFISSVTLALPLTLAALLVSKGIEIYNNMGTLTVGSVIDWATNLYEKLKRNKE